MKKTYERPIFLRAVKALVRVTLSDSFRIRPPSVPGIRPPSTQNPHICRSSDPVVRLDSCIGTAARPDLGTAVQQLYARLMAPAVSCLNRPPRCASESSFRANALFARSHDRATLVARNPRHSSSDPPPPPARSKLFFSPSPSTAAWS